MQTDPFVMGAVKMGRRDGRAFAPLTDSITQNQFGIQYSLDVSKARPSYGRIGSLEK